jgi:hypothetical protein
VFDQGKGVAGVFTTPVGFVNAQLAPLYGLPSDGYTSEFKQVELDATQRAGLLTLPGFLSSFAVLRSQIQELLARSDLSQSDRARLEQHFSAIRDLELRMVGMGPTAPAISDASIADMRAIDASPYDMAHHEKLIELHMRLMVFGIASGFTRVALLHRAVVNGASLCSQVDYIHQRHFKRLLDQLAAIQPATGSTLLDAGVTVWTNQCANGSHSFVNVPWILAGSAGGLLRTGEFIDVSDRKYNTNRMLNTLINAAGVRKDDSSLVDDFGDPSSARGSWTKS